MKILRITMLFAVLALSACTVEEIAEVVETREQELTIEAYREGDEVPTRTYRDDSDGSVWWVPGDAISLFYGQGTNGGSKFTSNATDTVKITNFTGTISVITGGAEITPEETCFWGLYPYSETASCDGSSVTMTLPSVQTAQAGSFATGLFPSLGRSEGLRMGFYNICSGLKFTVTKAGVKKVTLKSRSGELIAGTASVSFDADGHPAAEIIDGQDEVALEAPAGKSFEVGKPYFLVFFPTTFTGGFTVTLETLSETGVYEITSQITARRSIFGSISGLDAAVTYTPRSGNIPIEDANFKTYLAENFDTDGDGEISYAEAGEIMAINCHSRNIASVQGIEYMASLQQLLCYSNQLASLDVSSNMMLIELNCNSNKLTSLDVSSNTALTRLNCNSNQLTSLDVSNNKALTNLACIFNQLTSLDVSNNTVLIHLLCNSNHLTSLDVSNNTGLIEFTCHSNQLTSLDVSNNIVLTNLACSSNQLTSLDVSNNSLLTNLYCSSNLLSCLDVSNNPELSYLYCSPMNDNDGNNLLATLYIYEGQSIPKVTIDRSTNNIPAETRIVVKPEAVDLGLSVNWASFNLGATAPEEYGDYYAWGETEPKSDYSWSTYKWCGGSYNKLTKYCPSNKTSYWDGTGTPDGKTVLDSEDDAARANLGRTWRMPTDEEWAELRTNCNWTRTTENGVKGLRLTSKKEGFTDKSIFLPSAGSFYATNLNNAGTGGYYWSSSIDTDYPDCSWSTFFNASSVDSGYSDRCSGRSIRAVCPKD